MPANLKSIEILAKTTTLECAHQIKAAVGSDPSSINELTMIWNEVIRQAHQQMDGSERG